jgi:hypothetical protein
MNDPLEITEVGVERTVQTTPRGLVRVLTRRAALNAAAVFIAGLSASRLLRSSTAARAEPAKIKVINNSKSEIHHLFLSPALSKRWGPDQFGDNILPIGGSYTLNNIPCDSYDIRLVDEEGDECLVYDVNLCDDVIWRITDKMLLSCEEESNE